MSQCRFQLFAGAPGVSENSKMACHVGIGIAVEKLVAGWQLRQIIVPLQVFHKKSITMGFAPFQETVWIQLTVGTYYGGLLRGIQRDIHDNWVIDSLIRQICIAGIDV